MTSTVQMEKVRFTGIICLLCYVILTKNSYDLLHFSDEEMEPYEDALTCPRALSNKWQARI